MTETSEDLAAKHLAFKLHAAEVLHTEAEERDWCSEFDTLLRDVGLPARERFNQEDADYYRSAYGFKFAEDITGEDTVEAFDEWRKETSRTLRRAGIERYGYDQAFVFEKLAEAGFDTPRKVDYEVEGTFKVTATTYVDEGGDLIDEIDKTKLGRAVYYAIRDGSDDWRDDRYGQAKVTWKATVAE